MGYIKLLRDLLALRSNTKKSKEQITKIQDQKLRKLLFHAYDHSPYYQKSFKDASISKADLATIPLSSLPCIDKSILIQNFDQIVTTQDLTQQALQAFDSQEGENQDTFMQKYHVVHSSGSTGKPAYFVYDSDAWSQMLLGIIRAALWDMSTFNIFSLLLSRPKIAYVAATDGRYGGAMAVGGGIQGLHLQQLFLDIKTPLPQWIEKIKSFSPNIIIGYPSAIKILGELVEKGDVKVDVLRVISCGEPLGDQMRTYLEKTFNATVVNIYGASESLALGVETGTADGMYLFDDLNYIQVENGTMYLTSLYNMVQPLIRYKISDQLHLSQAKTTSPYPFTTAQNIVGRSEDLLWFEDQHSKRDFLHPLAIEGFCIEGLIDFQFMQTSSQAFEMIAQAPDKNRHSEIKSRMQNDMRRILQEKSLNYVNFDVTFTDHIMPDPKTGKKRLVLA